MHQTPGSVLQIHLRLHSYVSGVCRGAPAGNPVRKSKQLGNNTADLLFFFSFFLPCFCGGRTRWGWVGASWGATAIINLLALTQSFVSGGWGVSWESPAAPELMICSSAAVSTLKGGRRMRCCAPVELDGALPWTPAGCKQRKTIGRPSKNQVQSAATRHWNWMRGAIKLSNGRVFPFFFLFLSAWIRPQALTTVKKNSYFTSFLYY